MKSFIIATIAIFAATSGAMAATVVTTNNQFGPTSPNPSDNSWDPTYDPINTSHNVLLGSVAIGFNGQFSE